MSKYQSVDIATRISLKVLIAFETTVVEVLETFAISI